MLLERNTAPFFEFTAQYLVSVCHVTSIGSFVKDKFY